MEKDKSTNNEYHQLPTDLPLLVTTDVFKIFSIQTILYNETTDDNHYHYDQQHYNDYNCVHVCAFVCMCFIYNDLYSHGPKKSLLAMTEHVNMQH